MAGVYEHEDLAQVLYDNPDILYHLVTRLVLSQGEGFETSLPTVTV